MRMRKGLIIGLVIVFLLCFSAIAISSNLLSLSIIPGDKIDRPSSSGVTLIAGSWGNSSDAFGKADEGIDGPSSFVIGSNGDIYVLDQINQRIKQYDASGEFKKVINIDRRTVGNIAIAADGAIYLLDPILTKSILQYDSNGKLVQQARLNDNFQFATSLQVRGADVFAENQREEMYKIIDSGRALESDNQVNTKVPGKLKKDQAGTFMSARLLDKRNFHVLLTDYDGKTKLKIKAESKLNINQLLLLDSDSKGNIYVGLEVYEEGPAPDYQFINNQIVVAKYDPSGKLAGKIEFPRGHGFAPYKELEVDDKGNVYQLQTDDAGVKIVKWMFEK